MNEGDVYVKNAVEGMNGDELILFTFQELLTVLQRGRLHLERNEIESRVIAINKAIEVISTLQGILDFRAGDIAIKLRSLYAYSIQELIRANYERNTAPLDHVIRIFRGLLEAWKEKVDTQRHQGSIASEPGPAHNASRGESKSLEIYG